MERVSFEHNAVGKEDVLRLRLLVHELAIICFREKVLTAEKSRNFRATYLSLFSLRTFLL